MAPNGTPIYNVEIDVGMKHLSMALLGMLLCLNSWLPSPSLAASTELQRLIQTAIQNNPSLLAAEAEWQRSIHGILPAHSLDDPVLSLALLNVPVDSPRFDRTPMTGVEVRLTQKLPFPGKLALRGKVQEQKALWQKGLYAEKQLQVARQVKDAYYRYRLQQEVLNILAENRGLLDGLVKTVEAQYATGRASQRQLFQAQQQLTRLLDRILVEQQKQASLLAELETLTATAPLQLQATSPLPNNWQELPDVATAGRRAEENRPMLTAYQALIQQYRHEKRLAVLDEKSDFTLWAGYRFRDGGDMDAADGADFISAGVSFNLPFNQAKRRAGQAAADAGLRQATNAHANYLDQVRFNLGEALRRMERSRQQQRLYETTLLPQARQTWQAAINDFQVGRGDYRATLDLLLQLTDHELTFASLQTDDLRNQAWYEYETGQGPLPDRKEKVD